MKALLLSTLVALAASDCSRTTPAASTSATRTYFWGNNFYGQLGFAENNTVTPKFSYIGSEQTVRNEKCVGGFMNTGAIVVGPPNRVYFAGDSTSGQLGFGAAYEQAFRYFTSPVESLPYLDKDGSTAVSMKNLNVADVCMGWSHTCVIVYATATPDIRKVMCTGSNAVNQLGVSTFVTGRFQLFQPVLNSRRDAANRRTDTVFNNTVNFKSIHCGGDFTVALSTDGLLYGWGSNAVGQLGAGSATTISLATPITLPGLASGDKVSKVATGFAHTIVVTVQGSVYVFGSNGERQLAISGDVATVSTPTLATGVLATLGPSIRSIACGGYHCVVVAGGSVVDTTSGRVYAWGEGTVGQTGIPVPASKVNSRWYLDTPTLVPALSANAINTVAAGFKHTLVLDNCGTVFAFGSDAFGQLGVGGIGAAANFRIETPVAVPFVSQNSLVVRAICAGAFHSGFIATA